VQRDIQRHKGNVFKEEGRMKKGMIIAIAVALIMITAGVAIIATQDIRSLSDISTVDLEEKVFDVTDGFSDIYISDIEHDIRFMVSSDNKCYVKTRDSENMYHTVTVEDNALRVILYDTRKWYEHIGIYFEEQISVDVYLPAGEYGNLAVKSVSGDVEIGSEFCFESVSIGNTSGDVEFSAAASGLTVKTVSGDIEVSGSSGVSIIGDVTLTSTSGEITAVNMRPRDLNVRTVSGDIKLSDVTVENILSVGSTSGDISVSGYTTAGLEINASTVSGEIRLVKCDAPNLTIKSTSGAVWGSLLSGDKIFDAHSSSGSIHVPQSYAGGGVCKVNTTSGDINISITE